MADKIAKLKEQQDHEMSQSLKKRQNELQLKAEQLDQMLHDKDIEIQKLRILQQTQESTEITNLKKLLEDQTNLAQSYKNQLEVQKTFFDERTEIIKKQCQNKIEAIKAVWQK